MAVLDTSFLIALHARDPSALRLLRELDAHVVPSIVAAEFLTKFDRLDEAQAALEDSFHIAHTDRAWIEEAARMRAAWQGPPRSVRRADFWIAVWARLRDAPVVTRNAKDFEALGVRARSWG